METLHPKHRVPLLHLPDREDESFQVLEIHNAYAGCSWHFHSELQLCQVIEGTGQRVVGDQLCQIEPGEVVLLGSNLPHVWHYDPSKSERIHAIVVHFNEGFLGDEFLARPEMHDVRMLMKQAGQGLQALGQSRLSIEEKLVALRDGDGFDRVLTLLAILREFTKSDELRPICSTGIEPVAAPRDVERLKDVCDYVKANLCEEIDRDAASEVAHMSPAGFSRFFKSRTGIAFQDFVADARVGHACQLLRSADLAITEIAFQSGFSEVSTFNRAFRKFRHVTPTEYRQQVMQFCDAAACEPITPEA